MKRNENQLKYFIAYHFDKIRTPILKSNIRHSGLSIQRQISGKKTVYTSGTGAWVKDTIGREYIDFNLGYGSVVIGHANKHLNRRVAGWLSNGTLLPGYTSWHQKLISKWGPVLHLDNEIAFFKTASEAVTASIRLASFLTNKKGIIRCGFLGWHDSLLSKSVRWHEQLYSPLRYETRFTRGFKGNLMDEPIFNWTSLDLNELEEIITRNQHNLSCFVFDTYQTQFTNLDTFREAINICKKAGLIIVADETKIAGRVNPFGLAHHNLWPVDAVVMGKSIGNGAPFSCLIGHSELMKYSESARITGTFSQELLSIYYALACNEIMNEENGYEELNRIGTEICEVFEVAINDADINTLVKAKKLFSGSMLELVFSQKLISKWKARQRICDHLASAGIIMLQGHCSYVSLAHDQLDKAQVYELALKGFSSWSSEISETEF